MKALPQPVTLYQFELCPFCHKVKAGMEVKGLDYVSVEVNPYTKRELPKLPADSPKKVPVIEYDGTTVQDSTSILSFLDEKFPDSPPLLPSEAKAREKALAIEAWVDDDLTQVLPAVIYGTWGEAVQAAQVTAKTSNFGLMQNLMVRAGGSLIMHQVAKRIVAKRGGGNPHELLAKELDRLEDWLDGQPFVCGKEVSLGDVAAHGALTCIASFPAFSKVTERPRLAAWYQRVAEIREQNRRG